MSSFESLPNEIILLVFKYMSLFDLYQVFYYLNSTRLVQLLFAKQHSLVVGSLLLEQMCRLLHVSNRSHRQCLTNMIETLVVDDPYASTLFLQSVTPRMKKTQPFNRRFPSLKRFLIERLTYGYSSVLIPIVSKRISFPTMILKVENGEWLEWCSHEEPLSCLSYRSKLESYSKDLHQMASLYLFNTHWLTLSL